MLIVLQLTMTTPAKKVKRAEPSKKKLEATSITTSVGVRELRQSASKILDQVKNGVAFEITEHGVPIARLVPITKSLYEEYLAAGLIIPARNPDRVFKAPTGKVSKGKQLSELLIEDRRAAKF